MAEALEQRHHGVGGSKSHRAGQRFLSLMGGGVAVAGPAQGRLQGENSPSQGSRFEPLNLSDCGKFGVPALAGLAGGVGDSRDRLKPGLEAGEVYGERARPGCGRTRPRGLLVRTTPTHYSGRLRAVGFGARAHQTTAGAAVLPIAATASFGYGTSHSPLHVTAVQLKTARWWPSSES